MNRNEFGRLIVELRKRKGLSQKELADRLAFSPSAVNKWEHGINTPDMKTLAQMAELFGVSCDDLYNPERSLANLDALGKEGDKEAEGKEDIHEEPDLSLPEPEAVEVDMEKMQVGDVTVEPSHMEEPPTAEVQAEDIRKRKKPFRIACAAVVLVAVLVVTGIVGWKVYVSKQEPYIVQGHYIDDPEWGRAYEIAVVTPESFTIEGELLYMENVKLIFTQEQKIDTNTVKIRFYSNEEDALKWEGTESVGVVFLDVE